MHMFIILCSRGRSRGRGRARGGRGGPAAPNRPPAQRAGEQRDAGYGAAAGGRAREQRSTAREIVGEQEEGTTETKQQTALQQTR